MSSAKPKDSKYFNPSKKGEIHELKQELDTGAIEAKRECLKKIIAAMTIGKDVSMLFPDVVKQINTQDLELKKLVYLYVMNYAKSQPNLAILSVNAFVQDSTKNKNPLIRALAIRTMGCIRVEQITEYLCQPLQLCLKDEDPYVRKTAAVCVAKLYDISPSLVEAQGFLELLVELLSDANPMVVSNAVAALSEIAESSPNAFRITPHTLSKLLAALNECSEWGQIFILNALATYDPKDPREAEGIAERVTARLQHNNSAVVLGAIRVLMKYLDVIRSPEVIRTLTKKMGAPLVTLLSKEPELQYVALRNIILILQKRPTVLQHELKVFFCKYNDPLYVKMEKLEIMIMLVNERNVDQVLMELKEYATAADVEFVRKAVAAIGHTAIKLERAAERCIHVLLELIENGYNPVVQEAMIVIKDIFRKYPDQYESIIHKLCDNLELDEPGARAAMMWILGEYAERIDNAEDLLYGFLQNFLDEPYKVQLQLLTATVKLFLKRPKHAKDMVLRVLHLASEECSNPDIRDRGFMYWRLLTNPKAAKAVVLSKRPQIAEASSLLDPGVLDLLVAQISTLSAVYHQPPETFVPKLRRGQAQQAAERLKQLKEQNRAQSDDTSDDQDGNVGGESLLGDILTGNDLTSSSTSTSGGGGGQSILDLLGDSPATPPTTTSSSSSSLNDLLSGSGSFGVHQEQAAPQRKVLLAAAQGSGLQISGRFARDSSSPAGLKIEFTFENLSSIPLTTFAVQFNTNTFGLVPATPLQMQPLQPGQNGSTSLPLAFNPSHRTPPEVPPSPILQIAIKDNRDTVFFFADSVPFELLFSADGKLETGPFLQAWEELASTEKSFSLPIQLPLTLQQIQDRLTNANIFTVARRAIADREVFYCSAKVAGQVGILFEIAFPADLRSVVTNLRSRAVPLLVLVQDVIHRIVS